MRQSVLGKSVTISLVLHAGILGTLLLLAKAPMLPDRPLRVRIEGPSRPEAPPPAGPGALPAPPRGLPAPGRDRIPTERVERGRTIEPDVPPPPVRNGSSEPGPRGDRLARAEGTGTGAAPRGAPAPQPVAPPSAPPQTATAPSPPPQVASRPGPEIVPPPAEARRELRPEAPPSPDRSGLSLGGSSRDVPTPRPPSGSPGGAGPRLSLRDQIASLGSGLVEDTGQLAKQTIPLDDWNPRFLDYLGRLKARIQAEWGYPDEARRVGMGGELHLIFTLNKSGTLTAIRLVESSGYPVLDNEALRAVKAAAPYDPFPPQMGDEPWNVLATFRYHSYRR